MGDKKEGFTPLPNKVYETLAGSDLNSLQIRAILYLWRTTHGWRQNHKRLESRNIPFTEWTEKLNNEKSYIGRALTDLEKRNIIIRQYQGKGKGYNGYWLNTEVETWKSVASLAIPTVAKNVSNCCEISSEVLLPHTQSLASIKKNINKDIKIEDTPPLITSSVMESVITTPPLNESLTVKRKNKGLSNGVISSERDITIKKRITSVDHVEAFLQANGVSSIKAIAEGTGIDRNMVNTTLHNGKGKRFIHYPTKRAWGLPAMDELSPRSQPDSRESHHGASEAIPSGSVKPVKVFSNCYSGKIEWPGDRLKSEGDDLEQAIRDVLCVLDYGHAPRRPPEVEGNLEIMLHEDPSADTLELIRQWFESATDREAVKTWPEKRGNAFSNASL